MRKRERRSTTQHSKSTVGLFWRERGARKPVNILQCRAHTNYWWGTDPSETRKDFAAPQKPKHEAWKNAQQAQADISNPQYCNAEQLLEGRRNSLMKFLSSAVSSSLFVLSISRGGNNNNNSSSNNIYNMPPYSSSNKLQVQVQFWGGWGT